MAKKTTRRALMIARDHQALLRRVANIYQGPRGGRYAGPGGGGYAGPGGGKYIGPSNYAKGGKIGDNGGPPLDEMPPFKLHSGAAKLIAQKGQAKATPQQYAAIPGIKPDELKHSKFEALGNKALPKEQVLEHLRGNTIPLKETVLSEPNIDDIVADQLYDNRDVHEERFEDHHGRRARYEDELRRFVRDRLDPEDLEQYGAPRYADYKLPGGENYREVLLHLDHSPEAVDERARKMAAEKNINFDAEHPEFQKDWRENAKRELNASNYQSSHWDQPNVVAHLRMHDRKGPNGEKVLHVEEVQSDWGQEGREKGFNGPRKADMVVQPIGGGRWEIYNRGHGRTAVSFEGDEGIFNTRAEAEAALPHFQDDPYEHTEGVPAGPYVDNTQKWTDLALKRVLHEAAHGGYDKVVFTPGAEQNKRYSLSKQIRQINWSGDKDDRIVTLQPHHGNDIEFRVLPDGKVTGVGGQRTGSEFDGRAIHEVVGKEIGDKIMAARHGDLSGSGLEVGGAGMRGYYDNIMPKRLQALAQQHDPKAKVQLGGHKLRTATESPLRQRIRDAGYEPDEADVQTMLADNGGRRPSNMTDADLDAMERGEHLDYSNPTDTPLHSLDVTPQMRDSIKTNGFSQFKRGGAVEDEGPIADWHWRPLEDVRNELQIDEIPSHVHKFGEFMDESARRAMNEGFTPRDLIKAYTITRASIQRRAQPVENIRKSGLILPPDLKGVIRPEGAFGHWLHTKHGQRYLDAAEAGRIDEEAIADAQKVMKPFGKAEKDLPDGLRWAALNLPGQEGRISELVARAYRNQDHPDEWREATSGLRGIGPAKQGFYGANLGYGKLPTFDAREIITHTGRPTSEAVPYLRRRGAGDAAVDRLADRQTQLAFKHDKALSPFYQHMAHHTVWDKTAGEKTTHEDIVDPMRNAARGGRQEYARGGKGGKKEKPLSLIEGHPVLHPVQNALLQGLPAEAELQGLLRKAGIVRPYNQPSQADVEKALKIAQTYAMPLGTGSKNDPSAYYGVTQPLAARDVTTRATGIKGRSLKPEKLMSWQEFGDIGKGGHIVNLSGDRTRFATLHEINGKPLNWPVNVYAGHNYIREPMKGRAWASGPNVVMGLNNLVKKLSEKGPVFGMYSPYGGAGGDFAHHMFDAVMAQVNPDQISPAAKTKFDTMVREANFIMGQTDKIKAKRSRVKERMADWPGIDNPKAVSEFARTKLTGDQRKAILEMLDKKMWTDEGFPHVGMTRVAVTDPKLLGVPENVIGGNVALLKPTDKLPASDHPTFAAGQPGEYVGTLPFAPRHYALPVTTSHFLKTPSAGKGVFIDPYSLNDRARGGYRTLFERNYVPEPVSSQMVEGAEEGIKKMPLYGLKTGGSVVDRAVNRALDIAKKVTRG